VKKNEQPKKQGKKGLFGSRAQKKKPTIVRSADLGYSTRGKKVF
jgi:hypothetical protein